MNHNKFPLCSRKKFKHKIFPGLLVYQEIIAHICRQSNLEKTYSISLDFKLMKLLKLRYSYLSVIANLPKCKTLGINCIYLDFKCLFYDIKAFKIAFWICIKDIHLIVGHVDGELFLK